MIYKISIHSMVDLITNSSTVIYTWQDSTKQAKKTTPIPHELIAILSKAMHDR